MNTTFPWRNKRSSLQHQDIQALYEIRRNSLPANYRERRPSSASQLGSNVDLWHKPNIFMKGAAVPNSVVRNTSKMEEMRTMQAMYDRSYNQDTISMESIPLEFYRGSVEEKPSPQTQDEMLRTRLDLLDVAEKELEREESEQAGGLNEGRSSRRNSRQLMTKSKRSPPSESTLRSSEDSAFSQKTVKQSTAGTNIINAPSPSPSPSKNDTIGSENDNADDLFRELYSRMDEPLLFRNESVDNRLFILEEKEDTKYLQKASNLKSEPYTDKMGKKRTSVAFQHGEDTYDQHIAKRSKSDSGNMVEYSHSSIASKSEVSSLQSVTQANTPEKSTTDSTIGNESETANISSSTSDKPVQKGHTLPSKLRMLIEFNKMKRQKAARTPKETMQKMVHRVEREVNRRLSLAEAKISEDYEISKLLGLNQRGVSRAPTLDVIASVSQELIELFKSPSVQKGVNEETGSLDKNKQNESSTTKRKVRLDAHKASIASVDSPLEYGFVEPITSKDHEKTNQGKVDTSKRRRSVTRENDTPLLSVKKQLTTKPGSHDTETDERCMHKQPAQPKTNLVDKYVQEKQKRKNTRPGTKPAKQKDVAFADIVPQEEKARKVTPGFPVDIWDTTNV